MAGIRLILAAVVLAAVRLSSFAAEPKAPPKSEIVAHIRCAVCKTAVKEMSQHYKTNSTLENDEDALTDAIEVLCLASENLGKWISQIDVVQKTPGAQLTLDRRDTNGVCSHECKHVQRACFSSLKGKDEDLATLLKDGAGVGTMQKDICKKTCDKPIPALGAWEDEVWKEYVAPQRRRKPPKDTTPERGIDFCHDMLAGALGEYPGALGKDLQRMTQCTTFADEQTGAAINDDMRKACETFSSNMRQGIREILLRTKDMMRSGLNAIADGTDKLMIAYETSCDRDKPFARRLKHNAMKLAEYTADVDNDIEYEAKVVLKVHGHDMQKVVNKLIKAWLYEDDAYNPDGTGIGEALGRLLKKMEDKVPAQPAKAEL